MELRRRMGDRDRFCEMCRDTPKSELNYSVA